MDNTISKNDFSNVVSNPKNNHKKYIFELNGLGCANCGAKIEARVAELPGVVSASLNFPEKVLRITTEGEQELRPLLQSICDGVEHGIRVQGKASGKSGDDAEESISVRSLLIAAALLGIALLPFFEPWAKTALLLLSMAFAIPPVLKSAIGEWRARQMGENTLLMIALVAAFLIGEAVEGAMVALLFTLGELLEELAVGRSRTQIEKLAEIRPDTAYLLSTDGTSRSVSADTVEVGDHLLIPAHERVPVDCVVLQGVSEVDTSALTGESRPVYTAAGVTLLSGSINGSGTLTVQAVNRAESSAAARILDMVSESAARKGRAERFITRFARIYTPIVTVLALLVALVPPLVGLGEWHTWIYRALVFLVASCPCALVISVPLGFYSGIGAASKHGVLIKGGRFIEALANAKSIAFDKTGTLTTGKLTITRIDCAEGFDEPDVLRFAALAESHSSHPAAAAILEKAQVFQNGSISEQTELPGLGVRAVVDGKTILCGGLRLMQAYTIEVPWSDASVYLAVSEADAPPRAVAAFSMESEIHPKAQTALENLRRLGLTQMAMVTGDRREEADKIAGALAIPEVHADLLPENKLEVLRSIKAQYGTAIYVGDGINDAPVLAESDAGIAMGLGSSAAIEAGDIVLTAGNLERLPSAIRLARRVMAVVRFNIVFAMSIKIGVLILAVLGFAPMWLAVFADVGVSILSVLNAARLFISKN